LPVNNGRRDHADGRFWPRLSAAAPSPIPDDAPAEPGLCPM